MKKYLLTGTGLLLFSLFLDGYVSSGKAHIFSTEDTISHIKETLIDSLPDVPMHRESDVQEKFGPVGRICSGINIHFTKGHEKELDMIAAAGFKFIRMDLHSTPQALLRLHDGQPLPLSISRTKSSSGKSGMNQM
jgi:hypothetical protein